MGFNLGNAVKSVGGAVLGANVGSLFGGGVGAMAGFGKGFQLGGGANGNEVTGVGPGGLPQFKMRNTSEFMPNDPAEKIARTTVASPETSAISNRYNLLRTRAGQDANTASQQAQGAISRKFAAAGGTGSGAAIKLQQQAMDQAEKQKQDTLAGVNTEEQGALQQAEQHRAELQGQYDQQTNLAQAQMNQAQKQFNFEKGSKLHELDMAERQQQIDSAATSFNASMAAEMAKKPKQGFLSGIIGDIL
jgi:hypothetical protein